MRRYLTPPWLLGHLVAVLLVVAFLALGWWQVQRAGEGNVRSYAYAVEWPVFAGFVVFMWFREVRRASAEPEQDGEAGVEQTVGSAVETPPADRPPGPAPAAGEEDDELAAYNRMLAWLNADPHRRMIDYQG